MRWPFQREPSPDPDTDQARAEARRALKDARNFDQRVEHEMHKTRQIGLRNHFAEAVEMAIIPKGARRREA